jgi:PAS domain S-box-containing protein
MTKKAIKPIQEIQSNLITTQVDHTALLNALFDSTFEQSSLGKALIDARGNLLRVNKKLLLLSGYSFEELSDAYFTQLTNQGDGEATHRIYQLLRVEKDDDEPHRIHTFYRPDGKEMQLLTSLSRVYDEHGELSFYVKSFEDITLLRQNEMQIRRMAQEFDSFVYRAFHDLQGPLSSIEGICNVMKLSHEPAEVDQYANMIGDVANKMKRALMGMLEAAKINDLDMKKVVINFEDLVNNLLSDLNKLPESAKLDIRYRIQPDILYAADPTYLNIIIKHLLENAILFHNPQAAPSVIDLNIRQDADKQVCIRVRDNGVGIAEEDQEEVFQMFCRKSARSQGAGIGLYLVKQSVERLGGKIYLQSQIGKGTEIEVYL